MPVTGSSKRWAASSWISLTKTWGEAGLSNFRREWPTAFAAFTALVIDLVRGAWLRYVRQINGRILGSNADLSEFLFGSERASLAPVRPILLDFQGGRCFYCEQKLRNDGVHVDHFVPWSRYPVDLGHNFVLADGRCNTGKGDRLAAGQAQRKTGHGLAGGY